MKSLYLSLIIILCSANEMSGQLTQTTTINAVNSRVIQVQQYGTDPFCGGITYSMNSGGSSNFTGFTSVGNSSCITETTTKIRSVFPHPSFINSDITQVVVKFNVRMQASSPFSQIPFFVNIPSYGCALGTTAQPLYNCLTCFTQPCTIMAQNVLATSSWQAKTITITSAQAATFAAFLATSTDLIVGFRPTGGVIEIGNVRCDVTYNCTPPVTPSGLSATTVSSSQINLNWNAVAWATSYEIFTCTGTSPIATTSTTNHSITAGLQPGTNYGYRIKAVNNCAPSTNYSACASATTSLSMPSNLTATATSSSNINLTWSAVAGATGYDIYNCAGSLLGTSSGTSYAVTALSGGTNYTYKVRAKNATTISNFTSCTGALTFPNAPTGLVATPISSTEIYLVWPAVAGASSYDIYNCLGTLIGNSPSSNFNKNNLSPQTFYQYNVIAKNASGSSNASSCTNTTTLMESPTNLAATATSANDIQLTWNSVVNAISYDLYSCTGALIANIVGTTHSISGLLAGTTYDYKVKAIGSSNSSLFSACNGTITYPDVPTGLIATPISSHQIILDWDAMTGASSYDIYSCSGAFVGNTVTNNYTVTGLTPLTSYAYKLIAKNSSGNSGYSSCVNTTTLMPEPTNLIATATSISSIQLSWVGIGGAISYDVHDCNGVLIANVPGTSFTNTGLLSGTNYSYKVKAIGSTSTSGFTVCADAMTFLEAPAGFAVNTPGHSSNLHLQWNPVVGATSYDIYSCAGTFITSVSSPANSTVISNLVYDTYYDFKIKAVNSLGASLLSVCAGGTTLLPPITNFTATVISGSEVKLDWDPAPGVSSYEIWHTGVVGSISTTSTSYIVSNLTPQPTYGLGFSVKGIGATNQTAFTGVQHVDLKLETPQIYSVEYFDYSPTVSWNRFFLKWITVPNATGYEISSCSGSVLAITTQVDNHNLYTIIPGGDSRSFKIRALFAGNTNSTSSFSACKEGFNIPPCSSGSSVSTSASKICAGEPVTLNVSGASTSYNWSHGLGTGNSVTASPLVTTTYTVDGNGDCYSAPVSVTISVIPAPVFYIGADVILCEEDPFPAMICADNTNPGDFYNWTLNGVALPGPPLSCYEPSQVGTYCLEIVNAAECSSMDCINIELSPLADYDPAFSVSQSCEDGQNEFSVSVSFNILATGLSQKFEVYHMVNGSLVYQGVYYAAYNTSYLFIPFPFVQTETYKIVRKVWYPNCPEEIEIKKTVRCPGGNSETEGRSTAGGNVSNSQNEMISLDVYPNPNNGQFAIELDNESNASIVVYNLMGKIVFSKNTEGNIQNINISEQPKGIYFVKVSIGSKVFNEKIVYQ